jgi:hypothetical protein
MEGTTAVDYLSAGARLMEAAEGLDDKTRRVLEHLAAAYYDRACALMSAARVEVGEER